MNQKLSNTLFKVIIGFVSVIFLWNCSGVKTKEELALEDTPAHLLEEGLKLFDDRDYFYAKPALQKIVDRYPYSKESVIAELRVADCMYHMREYDLAFESYNEFQRLHPKNPDVPYVLYQMGMCHFKQTSTIDRDQSHTQRAKENFERLVKIFPNSEYASQAHWKIRECFIALASAELYVGHFYYKMKKYEAAMGRYRRILEEYPDLGQYHEALEYLGKSMDKLAAQKTNP